MRHVLVAIGCAACSDSSTATGDAAVDGAPGTCETTTPWAAAPALALGATQETAVVATGGKLYVLGGFHGTDGVVPAVQIFDPVACRWSAGPDLPKPLHHINAAVVDGTIYILGALEGAAFTATGDAWAWNPQTDATWTPRTAMPAGTQRGAAVVGVIDGQIYVAGGLRTGAVDDVSMFDPQANEWATLDAMPMRRDHACGGAIAGKLYVAGGRQASITTQSPLVFEYTPGGAWQSRMSMPTARGGTACGVVGDRLVVVGGEGNAAVPSGVFPQVEAYDAIADQWTVLAPMPTPRHGMGAAVIDGRLYVPGGATRQGFGASAVHEVFTP